MFAPRLYMVRKYTLQELDSQHYNITISFEDEKLYKLKEQDNQLFRQIRLIDNTDGEIVYLDGKDKDGKQKTIKYNKYIVFVDCKQSNSEKEEKLSKLIANGFVINNQKFVFSERSASMTRNSIISFVDKTIIEELDERVGMGIDVGKTVLSKYYAYRGLMLSSCHCIEDWIPKIIVVPDCYTTIKNQRIKYLYDKEIKFTDKNDNERVWNQKDVAEGVRDIEINAFDGSGIHHPYITQYVKEVLNTIINPTSLMWRMPFIKGVTHETNYVQFFADKGITFIKDIWGIEHGVTANDEPMIIMTESMYKGCKYFKNNGDYSDWERYWEQFKKYNHCIGVAKWNFSLEEEPIYTRGNYQILQDLDLSYSEFAKLAKYSIDWAERIIEDDKLAVFCALGLFADKCKPLNNYTKAILKNPEMLKERGVRDYLIKLWSKQFDNMKCGKLWLKGAFKFLAPDLIMLMEHIGGLETKGCLESNEFFTQDVNGSVVGERVIERNPHICASEHVILTGVDNELINKYLPNLINVCMVNSKSIVMQKMNGADTDGDLVLVLDDNIIKSGINRDLPTVIDIDDKVTSESELDTPENKTKVALRTMKNLIGEYSNYASAYHNKTPKTQAQKEKYNKFIDIISVLTGKSIDYAKTGVLYVMPKFIAKYGRPLPYFMRYRSNYYLNQKLSRAGSNMNRLCWEIEKWDKTFRWKRTYKDFDYNIMIDHNCLPSETVFLEIEKVFLRFCLEMIQLKRDEYDIRKDYRDFTINWDYYYNQFRKECEGICPDKKMLANAAVKLCYEKYPNKNNKFIWRVAGDGVIDNLKQVDIMLPLKSSDGKYEYLGKLYTISKPQYDEHANCIDSAETEWEESFDD